MAANFADAICAAGNGAHEAIRVYVENAILECPEGRLDRCHGESHYTVANCSDEPIELRALVFGDEKDNGRRMIVEPAEKTIAPHATWSWTSKVDREQSLKIHIDAVDRHGAPIEVAAQPVRVSNPTREAAMEACEACGGIWGIEGLSYHDACNCRTRDAGRECRDGKECEGACTFDHWEVTVPAPPSTCRGRTCRAGPAGIGRPIGRCSDRVILRSCHTLLGEDIAYVPEQALPWGVSRICID